MKIVEDSDPGALPLALPRMLYFPVPRDQAVALFSEAFGNPATMSADRQQWVQFVEKLQERWAAHKDRFFAFFIAHESTDIVDKAVELHDGVTRYLHMLAGAAPLMSKMVELVRSPNFAQTEHMQQRLVDLSTRANSEEIIGLYGDLQEIGSLLFTFVDQWSARRRPKFPSELAD